MALEGSTAAPQTGSFNFVSILHSFRPAGTRRTELHVRREGSGRDGNSLIAFLIRLSGIRDGVLFFHGRDEAVASGGGIGRERGLPDLHAFAEAGLAAHFEADRV